MLRFYVGKGFGFFFKRLNIGLFCVCFIVNESHYSPESNTFEDDDGDCGGGGGDVL